MGCSMGPQEYVFTVVANDNTGTGTPPNGLFNPITALLPLTQFDRIRLTVEVLSYTPQIVFQLAGRVSADGVAFNGEFLTFADAVAPGVDTWMRTGWIDVTTGGNPADFVQMGVIAWRATSVSREMAVVRVRVEFKMGT